MIGIGPMIIIPVLTLFSETKEESIIRVAPMKRSVKPTRNNLNAITLSDTFPSLHSIKEYLGEKDKYY